MNRRSVLTASGGLLAALAGCGAVESITRDLGGGPGDAWRQPYADAANTSHVDVSGPEAPVEDDWRVGANPVLDHSILVDRDRAFLPTEDGVGCYDLATGDATAAVGRDFELISPLALADGAVLSFGLVPDSQTVGLLSIDRTTGERRWHAPPVATGAALTVADELLVVPYGRDGAAAIDAGSGIERWRYPDIAVTERDADAAWRDGDSEAFAAVPAVRDGRVFLLTGFEPDGHGRGGAFALHAVDATTGDRLWRRDVAFPTHESPRDVLRSGYQYVDDPIVAGEDAVFLLKRRRMPTFPPGTAVDEAPPFGTDQLFAYDPSTGERLWTFDFAGTGASEGLAVADGAVHVGERSKLFTESGTERVHRWYVLDGATGEPRSTVDLPPAPEIGELGTPTLADDIAYLPSGQRVLAIDPDEGQVLWAHECECEGRPDQPVVTDERVLVAAGESVTAIGGENG